MPEALLPANESARLALLHALQLLDTAPEEEFDRITRLAARVLNVPSAAVSFIDRDRQWFKSRVGLPMSETPRSIAFCSHAILQSEPLVVTDPRSDPRFADHPMLDGEPGVQFYAGVPILSADGYALGTLCVFDWKPREFAAEDLEAITDLAALIRREILNREALLRSGDLSQKSQRALELSEMQMRAMFDQAAVGIVRISLNGKDIHANPKFCEIVGYSQAELYTLNYACLKHPDEVSDGRVLMERLLKGDAFHCSEMRYVHKNGEVIWVKVTSSLVRDSDGRPLFLFNVIEDIGARKAAEEALQALRHDLENQVRERTEHLRAVLVNSQDAYICLDEDGRIVDWNPQAEKTFGWPADEAVGRLLTETIVPPHLRTVHQTGIESFTATAYGPVFGRRVEMPAVRRDGREIAVEISVCVLPSENGHRFSAFLHDISERKAAEAALRHSQEQLRAIANNIPAAIGYIDSAGVLRYVNDGHRHLLGIDPAALEGRPVMDIITADQREPMLNCHKRALAGERVQRDVYDPERNMYLQVRMEPDRCDGEIVGYFSITTDITNIKQSELEHKRDAQRDELTGLPNRRALMQRLPEAIARTQHSGQTFGVLFLDLDGFKQVNDCLGHEIGDELLRQFGQRLSQSVRSSDLVARLAGDEFVIVVEGLTDGSTDLDRMAKKIGAALCRPFLLANCEYRIGASIGTKIYTWGESVEALLAAADQAMYVVKRGHTLTRSRGVGDPVG